MSAFVDDRDRDPRVYLGGALVCAGDDCLSLVECQRHSDPLELDGQLSRQEPAMPKSMIEVQL